MLFLVSGKPEITRRGLPGFFRRAVLLSRGLLFRGSLVAAALTPFDAPGQKSLVTQDLFVRGEGGYHTYRSPAIVVSPRGVILAFCEGRKSDSSDSGDIDLLLRRTTDGGGRWSTPRIVHEEGGGAKIAIANPCPISHAKSGVVHLLFTRDRETAFYTRSRDDGLTWSPPRDITEAFRGFHYPFQRLGIGPGHGIVTESGRLVAPVWVRNDRFSHEVKEIDNAVSRAGVLVSDDFGRTWKAGGLLAPALPRLNECAVAEAGDGTLLLNARGRGTGYRAVSRSRKRRPWWNQPKLNEKLPCPGCHASLLSFTEAPPKKPRLFLFCNPAMSSNEPFDPKARRKLTVRLSRDEGRTWPQSKVLEDGPSGYSDLAITSRGLILCLYENGESHYNEKISLAQFNLAWLQAGK